MLEDGHLPLSRFTCITFCLPLRGNAELIRIGASRLLEKVINKKIHTITKRSLVPNKQYQKMISELKMLHTTHAREHY